MAGGAGAGLFAVLRQLADDVEAGVVVSAEVAARLRELATFIPTDACRAWVGFSTVLAELDAPFTWYVEHGGPAARGVEPRIVSNAHTKHGSNFGTELDLDGCDPGAVDQFGRALLHLAGLMAAERAAGDEEL